MCQELHEVPVPGPKWLLCSFRASPTPGTLSSDSTQGSRSQITSKLLWKGAVNSSDGEEFGAASN